MTDSLNSLHLQMMVKAFLAKRFNIAADQITAETPMREIGLDSILMLDVLLEVEDSLCLKLTDIALPASPKLGDIVELIQRNLGKNP